MLKTSLVGLFTLTLAGGVLAACDDDDDVEDIIDERIDDLDIDDDSFVTREEWADAFVIWDEDNDRVLVVDEFRFNGGGFEAADEDNDGFVTEDEWEDLLGEWDLDHNDVLENFELAPYL